MIFDLSKANVFITTHSEVIGLGLSLEVSVYRKFFQVNVVLMEEQMTYNEFKIGPWKKAIQQENKINF